MKRYGGVDYRVVTKSGRVIHLRRSRLSHPDGAFGNTRCGLSTHLRPVDEDDARPVCRDCQVEKAQEEGDFIVD